MTSVCQQLGALFGLAFAAPPPVTGLGLLRAITRRLIMQKAGGHPIKRLPLTCRQFRYYFTPLTGVLFTFPSRYWFTVGRHRVFSLTPWSAQIHTGFHVSRATQDTSRLSSVFAYGALTLYGRPFQVVLLTSEIPRRGPTTPKG